MRPIFAGSRIVGPGFVRKTCPDAFCNLDLWRPFPLGTMGHPRSGYHYIHVIQAHPVFADEYGMWRAEAIRTPWMSLVGIKSQDSYNVLSSSPAWRDPRNMFIHWSTSMMRIPVAPGAKHALNYNEAVGTPEDLVGLQREYQRGLRRNAYLYHLCFENTPTGVEFLKGFHPNARLAPVGFNAEVMGSPDWNATKRYDLAIYGTPVSESRRSSIWAKIMERFAGRVINITGAWGFERNRRLNECRAILHIAHSRCTAASMLRVWQAMATSAALIKEADDAWPAEPGRHFFQVPRFEDVSEEQFFSEVEKVLAEGDLPAMARRANEELSAYTQRRIMEEFYVPASMSVPM